MTKLLPASFITAALLLAVLPTSRILPVSADDVSAQGVVDFSEFVEHTSIDTRDVNTGDVNGLYLTLGETVIVGDEGVGGACLIGGEEFKGTMNNIVHTIQPVFFNETTNTIPGITVSSYPEGLIQTFFYGEQDGDRFLRLSYDKDMLKATGTKSTPPTEISDPETNETTYEYPSYGVLIQFPALELEEVHLGGDILVQIKEGFANMTLLRATDRVQVHASSKLPFFDNNNGTKTFEVRTSQNAMVTLDVGHDTVKPVKAIAIGNSTLSIRGSVETIECVNNSTCIVDGKLHSEDCNDSMVATNATLETDECACVVVVGVTIIPGDLNEIATSTSRTTGLFDEEFAAADGDGGINFNTAKCLDTTYIPPVVATTNGPSTTNATFSCPAEKIVIISDNNGDSSSSEASNGDSSSGGDTPVQEDVASSVTISRVMLMAMVSLLSVFVLV